MTTYTIFILRRERGARQACWERFVYGSETDHDTVASALRGLNDREPLTNAAGAPVRRIEWECSCLQKRCGACAMLINGRPRLACDARLSEFSEGEIWLEPLKKFPPVCDLVVDRSILFENLKRMRLWLRTDAELADGDQELAYAASGCIQCGCCLEVCPNFYPGGSFFGMAAVPIATRLLTEMPTKEARELARLYAAHAFEGCGKSFACKNICPRGIDTEELMVNANALALWKRKRRKHDTQ